MKLSIKSGVVTGFKDEVQIKGIEYETISSRRVSNIYPVNTLLKYLFISIRRFVKDESKIANWTRDWKVSWSVYYKNKSYGCFNDRKEAIKYEKNLVWKDLKEK